MSVSFVAVVLCYLVTLLKVYHRDSSTAELHMLVSKVGDVGNGREVLPNELAQNAIALAMKDSDLSDSDKNGIVNKVLNGIHSLVTSHAPYVNFLSESRTPVVYRLSRCLFKRYIKEISVLVGRRNIC